MLPPETPVPSAAAVLEAEARQDPLLDMITRTRNFINHNPQAHFGIPNTDSLAVHNTKAFQGVSNAITLEELTEAQNDPISEIVNKKNGKLPSLSELVHLIAYAKKDDAIKGIYIKCQQLQYIQVRFK
mgnify:CR=1 FL=1